MSTEIKQAPGLQGYLGSSPHCRGKMALAEAPAPSEGENMTGEPRDSHSHSIHSQEADSNSNGCFRSVDFLSLMQSRIPAKETVPPTVGRSSIAANLI